MLYLAFRELEIHKLDSPIANPPARGMMIQSSGELRKLRLVLVNARVSLVDIDSVAVGQKAEIRLTALNARMTPTIFGSVISVSGDSLKEKRTNQEYFLTRIEIPPEEKQKLGKVKLTAGMPADVLIQTGERTALNYILKPLLDAMAHGLNEE